MTLSPTKCVTIVLILLLGIMQLLLPFLHGHVESSAVHADSRAQLLHLHSVDNGVNLQLTHQQTAVLDDTYLASQHDAEHIVSVSQAIPNQNDLSKLALFVAFTFVTLVAYIVSRKVRYINAPAIFCEFVYQQHLSRAPPLA